LGGDAPPVGVQEPDPTDEVRGDGGQVDGGPTGPAGVGDAQPLGRVGHLGGGTVDGDGTS
jgi:hypothetical protein